MKKMLVVSLLFLAICTTCSMAGEASHKKTALELLEITNAEETFDQMLTSMESMMEQQLIATDLTQEAKEASQAMQKEMMDWMSGFFSWEQLREQYADIYVEVFTEGELKELIEFYQSPIGQKFLSKMPDIIQKSMELTQTVALDMWPEFNERLQKRILELDEEQEDD
ncbi:MAG: DUF2059 domain-containing protein [candidate division Zixibacteria bacterium]|nr:DUF2059 domain-containing protein [candidate division Zixibacteria bacterium]